jgi:DNA helicase-2/ATP-dependent DNA helicase PcrA
LDPPEGTSGDARANQIDEDYVILATIHWAKGGEWKIVRVLSVVEGSIPSGLATRTANEIEEERRLLHVAMTRAEDELDLIVPQRIYQRKGDDAGYVNSKISRFIPNSIHHAFESKHWGERSSERDFGRSKWRSKRIDVASSVEQMWR